MIFCVFSWYILAAARLWIFFTMHNQVFYYYVFYLVLRIETVKDGEWENAVQHLYIFQNYVTDLTPVSGVVILLIRRK